MLHTCDGDAVEAEVVQRMPMNADELLELRALNDAPGGFRPSPALVERETAAREAARSEAGRAAQRCTDKARSKRRRKAARALERGAAEAAGSGATAGEQ